MRESRKHQKICLRWHIVSDCEPVEMVSNLVPDEVSIQKPH